MNMPYSVCPASESETVSEQTTLARSMSLLQVVCVSSFFFFSSVVLAICKLELNYPLLNADSYNFNHLILE